MVCFTESAIVFPIDLVWKILNLPFLSVVDRSKSSLNFGRELNVQQAAGQKIDIICSSLSHNAWHSDSSSIECSKARGYAFLRVQLGPVFSLRVCILSVLILRPKGVLGCVLSILIACSV